MSLVSLKLITLLGYFIVSVLLTIACKKRFILFYERQYFNAKDLKLISLHAAFIAMMIVNTIDIVIDGDSIANPYRAVIFLMVSMLMMVGYIYRREQEKQYLEMVITLPRLQKTWLKMLKYRLFLLTSITSFIFFAFEAFYFIHSK